MADSDNVDAVLVAVDAVDDPEVAPPRRAMAFELEVELTAYSERRLGQRPVGELDDCGRDFLREAGQIPLSARCPRDVEGVAITFVAHGREGPPS